MRFPQHDSKRRPEGIVLALIYLVVGMGAMIMVFPFYIMLMDSLKPDAYLMTGPFDFRHLTLENYAVAFREANLLRYGMNSFILAFSGVVTNLLFGSLAGFAFERLEFPGKRFLFMALLASLMIPGAVLLVPRFLIMKSFPLAGGNNLLGQGGHGLVNNFLAIILPGASGAFSIFFMRQFFKSIPRELDDAARIDGASPFQIFVKIFVPLSKPALATLGVLTFQAGWNNFLEPLIYLNSEHMRTIQLALQVFVGHYSSQWNLLMAGTIVATLPLLALFALAQRYFVEGINFSGMKF